MVFSNLSITLNKKLKLKIGATFNIFMSNYFPIKILVVTIEENTNICKCFNLKLKWELETSIEQTLDHDLHIKIIINFLLTSKFKKQFEIPKL
jgi:hypothetical protein